MGKERVEKKEKKEKRSSKDGVKKSKKDKKTKVVDEVVTAALEEQLKEAAAPVAEARVQVTEQEGELVVKAVGALVPFAAPLADEKVAKKVLKSVKKGTC
jgi:H/ACA ribonucleoprotein complex subunit 2